MGGDPRDQLEARVEDHDLVALLSRDKDVSRRLRVPGTRQCAQNTREYRPLKYTPSRYHYPCPALPLTYEQNSFWLPGHRLLP
jgi:hypothetical protein